MKGKRTRGPRGRGSARGQVGISLIELVIVILVFGIAAAGMMTMFSTGMTKSADPLLLNQALQLAQEKMDIILGDRANPARGFGWIAGANYPPESPVAGFPGFNRSVSFYCALPAALNTPTADPVPCTITSHTHVTVTVTQAALPSPVTVETVVVDY